MERRDAKLGRETSRSDPVDGGPQDHPSRTPATDFLARVRLGAATDNGFRERWALFWANHFTVSAQKLVTATLVGPFEQEAIRPHVFGRFEDLLVASSSHPTMLLYLDQAQSIGPNSPIKRQGGTGSERRSGLNENLAREIMELHTVGRRGGLFTGRRHRVRPRYDRLEHRGLAQRRRRRTRSVPISRGRPMNRAFAR